MPDEVSAVVSQLQRVQQRMMADTVAMAEALEGLTVTRWEAWTGLLVELSLETNRKLLSLRVSLTLTLVVVHLGQLDMGLEPYVHDTQNCAQCFMKTPTGGGDMPGCGGDMLAVLSVQADVSRQDQKHMAPARRMEVFMNRLAPIFFLLRAAPAVPVLSHGCSCSGSH